MITILLVILLIIALAMIGTVLLQRSEGGALGIGGGGGGMGGLISTRGSANLLTRATGVLAFLFFAVCLVLAVLTGGDRSIGTVVEDETLPADAAPAEDLAAEPAGPTVPEAAGELMIIPDDTPAGEAPAAIPSVPEADADYLVIPDDLTENWDPDAVESQPAPVVPDVDFAPSLPDVDLPAVPDASGSATTDTGPAMPEPADSGVSPAAPAVPSAD